MQKLPEVTRKLCRGSQEQKTKKREGGWDSRREGRCATLKKKRPDVRSRIPPSVGRKTENYEKSERGWDFWGLNRERGWDNSTQGRRGWFPPLVGGGHDRDESDQLEQYQAHQESNWFRTTRPACLVDVEHSGRHAVHLTVVLVPGERDSRAHADVSKKQASAVSRGRVRPRAPRTPRTPRTAAYAPYAPYALYGRVRPRTPRTPRTAAYSSVRPVRPVRLVRPRTPRMSARAHTCACSRAETRARDRAHVRMPAHTHARTRACTQAHVGMHACAHARAARATRTTCTACATCTVCTTRPACTTSAAHATRAACATRAARGVRHGVRDVHGVRAAARRPQLRDASGADGGPMRA